MRDADKASVPMAAPAAVAIRVRRRDIFLTKPEMIVTCIRIGGIWPARGNSGGELGSHSAALGETDEADARERFDAYNLRREREARTIFFISSLITF